jgi:transcriptional regulator with XRE-family HTH domain
MIKVSDMFINGGDNMSDNTKVNLVGLRVQQIRESKGIKAKFIAKEIGISATRYSQLENGKIPITTERLEQIADILGVSKSQMHIFFDPYVNNVLTLTRTE